MSRAEILALLADPDRLDAVELEALPGLIGEAEALRARLWARLQAGAVPAGPTPPPPASGGPDRLLTADEAAERLGVSKRWMYRKADVLPFTRRLSGGTLRFSERGMERWQKAKAA